MSTLSVCTFWPPGRYMSKFHHLVIAVSKPLVAGTIGFNLLESYDKLGFPMSKDSTTAVK
jgi:hypothetical protein